jgi:hypothetical protein
MTHFIKDNNHHFPKNIVHFGMCHTINSITNYNLPDISKEEDKNTPTQKKARKDQPTKYERQQ